MKWFDDGMGFDRWWRVVGLAIASLYAGLAFDAGLNHDRFWLFADCMIAGLNVFSAAKSHSRVKDYEKRHGRP